MLNELLDVVNERDKMIFQESRSVVHQKGLLHRGVHVFLVAPDGRLLVQQRGRQVEKLALALDCSLSEHVQAGENYNQAAKRGLAEELGIQGSRISPIIKFIMAYGPNDNEICQLYEGMVDPVNVHYNPNEVEGINYYHLNELEKLHQGGEASLTGWFVQMINWYVGKSSELRILKKYSHSHLWK
jgi:16S rRNA (adenine1518-N6/adenine1519-N6)-dimethyltransferase